MPIADRNILTRLDFLQSTPRLSTLRSRHHREACMILNRALGPNYEVNYERAMDVDDVYYKITYRNQHRHTVRHSDLVRHISNNTVTRLMDEISTYLEHTYEAHQRAGFGRVRLRPEATYRAEYGHNLTMGSVDKNRKPVQKFSKKHPLKMQFIRNPEDSKKKQKENYQKLVAYKEFMKKDKSMPDKLKNEVTREIHRLRGRLKFNASKMHDKFVLKYKGVQQDVPFSPSGFVDKQYYHQAKNDLVRRLKKERSIIKREKSDLKSLEGVNYALVGGVHQHKNTILNMFRDVAYRRVNSLRKPKTDQNHIGIEIEFFSSHPREEVTQMIIDSKLSANCRIMTDSSIRPREGKRYGYELCLLAPEKDVDKYIEQACDLLGSLEAEVNDSCGLHVHLDCRQRDPKVLYSNLYHCQELLFSLVAPSRKENNYCRQSNSANFEDGGTSHYDAINREAYRKHRTIEVRMHHGTLSSKDIINWVKLLTSIANYDKSITKKVDKPSEVTDFVRLETPVYEYFDSRYRLFGGL